MRELREVPLMANTLAATEIEPGPALAIKDSGPIAQSFFGGGSYRKFKIMSGVWHSSPLMGYCGFVKAFYLARSGEPQEVGGLGGTRMKNQK
jgi:hypothetical protein